MFQIAKNLPGIEVGPNTEQICVIHQSGSKKNLDICTKRTKILLCLLIGSMKCILAFIKLIIHQLINALLLLYYYYYYYCFWAYVLTIKLKFSL